MKKIVGMFAIIGILLAGCGGQESTPRVESEAASTMYTFHTPSTTTTPSSTTFSGPIVWYCDKTTNTNVVDTGIVKLNPSTGEVVDIQQYSESECVDPSQGLRSQFDEQWSRLKFNSDYTKIWAHSEAVRREGGRLPVDLPSGCIVGYYDLKLEKYVNITYLLTPTDIGEFEATPCYEDYGDAPWTEDGLRTFADVRAGEYVFYDVYTNTVVRRSADPYFPESIAPMVDEYTGNGNPRTGAGAGTEPLYKACGGLWVVNDTTYLYREASPSQADAVARTHVSINSPARCSGSTGGESRTLAESGWNTGVPISPSNSRDWLAAASPDGATIVLTTTVYAQNENALRKFYLANREKPDQPIEIDVQRPFSLTDVKFLDWEEGTS
ncbi:hypothetical protein VX037_18670 [Gordonia sp. Z-3]|uniref:hypothetical protein n=1 Tax=Gordonia sp. Z-3 TaxID=3115408 RepID=UPI002E2E4013|nr:hypothetical protein [Gordonia sp. Z-3]MED5803052.1 hypothetical protein [Gordonia sp. Z-3]